jgi:hypothetical protein
MPSHLKQLDKLNCVHFFFDLGLGWRYGSILKLWGLENSVVVFLSKVEISKEDQILRYSLLKTLICNLLYT